MMQRKMFLMLVMIFTGLTGIHAHHISNDNFDEESPVIITQNATFFMPGQDIQISLLVNTNSSLKLKEITINGAGAALKDGVASYTFPVGSIGVHEIPVKVIFVDKAEELQTRNYNVKYEVGQANAAISLDKMNVLYIGIDNTVSISCSAGGDFKMTVSVVGGGSSLRKIGPGIYNVQVTEMTDDCSINVYVDGRIVASSQFRVRNLPVPIGTVGGFSSGDTVETNAFRRQPGVGVYIKDFPLSLKYIVERYTITISDSKGGIKTISCEGAKFSEEVISMIKDQAKSGSTVIIGNLMARDEGGRSLKLAPLIYYLK